MAFKLLDMAQQRWRRLDGAAFLPSVVPARPLSMELRNKHELLLNQLKPRRGKPPDHADAIHNN